MLYCGRGLIREGATLMAFKVINTESFLIEPARSHLETNDCEVIENHLAEIGMTIAI